MKIQFEKKADIEDMTSIVERISRDLFDLSSGKWEVKIGKPTRTPLQNNTIHGIFKEIADKMMEHGLENRLTIKARPTADNIKVFFKENILKGATSEATTKELAEALDVLMDSFNEFFTEKGIQVVRIDSKQTQQLLDK